MLDSELNSHDSDNNEANGRGRSEPETASASAAPAAPAAPVAPPSAVPAAPTAPTMPAAPAAVFQAPQVLFQPPAPTAAPATGGRDAGARDAGARDTGARDLTDGGADGESGADSDPSRTG